MLLLLLETFEAQRVAEDILRRCRHIQAWASWHQCGACRLQGSVLLWCLACLLHVPRAALLHAPGAAGHLLEMCDALNVVRVFAPCKCWPVMVEPALNLHSCQHLRVLLEVSALPTCAAVCTARRLAPR